MRQAAVLSVLLVVGVFLPARELTAQDRGVWGVAAGQLRAQDLDRNFVV